MFTNGYKFKNGAALVDFFRQGAQGLSIEQLTEIAEAIPALIEWHQRDAEQMAKALADLTTIAERRGIDIGQLLGTGASRQFIGKVTSGAASKGAGRKQFRKPHLNPLDPDTDAYSLDKVREKPEWLIQLEADGWTIDDLHYKNISRAALLRNVSLPWDPIEKHAEIAARHNKAR